jgi:hypothetical protein
MHKVEKPLDDVRTVLTLREDFEVSRRNSSQRLKILVHRSTAQSSRAEQAVRRVVQNSTARSVDDFLQLC